MNLLELQFSTPQNQQMTTPTPRRSSRLSQSSSKSKSASNYAEATKPSPTFDKEYIDSLFFNIDNKMSEQFKTTKEDFSQQLKINDDKFNSKLDRMMDSMATNNEVLTNKFDMKFTEVQNKLDIKLQEYDDQFEQFEKTFNEQKEEFDTKATEFDIKVKAFAETQLELDTAEEMDSKHPPSIEVPQKIPAVSQGNPRKPSISQSINNHSDDSSSNHKLLFSEGINIWYKKDPFSTYRARILKIISHGDSALYVINIIDSEGNILQHHRDFLKVQFLVTEDSLTHKTPSPEMNKDSYTFSDKMSSQDVRNVSSQDVRTMHNDPPLSHLVTPRRHHHNNDRDFNGSPTKHPMKSNFRHRYDTGHISKTQNDEVFFNDDEDSDGFNLQRQSQHITPTSRAFSEKSFIYYPKSHQPMTVLDIYLPKLTTKLVINDDQDLISFYHTFRSRLESYNILIRNYDDINKHEGVKLLNSTNSENCDHANQVMSRAIFNYLDDKKDDIMSNYAYGYKLLKYYESNHDGFSYLERLMERAHPKLRNAMTHSQEKLKPQLNESESIFDFIKLYLEWLQYESQEVPSRTYSDSVKLNYIISQLQLLQNPSLSMAINYLISRRDILFCDPTHPQPLPPDLQLDRIGNTIWDRVNEGSRNDLLNINPIIVNKAITRSKYRGNKDNPIDISKGKPQTLYNPSLRKPYPVNPYGKSQNTDVTDSNYKRRAIQKYCEVCKRWGHDLAHCDALATHCLVAKFLENCKDNQVETALDTYHKHQSKVRRKHLSRLKLNRRITKLEDTGIDSDVVQAAVMLCHDITEDLSSSDENSDTDYTSE